MYTEKHCVVESPARPRVTFVWNEVNAYMAACWCQLQNTCELSIVSYPTKRPYDNNVVAAVNNHTLLADSSFETLRSAVLAGKPDILVICGWGKRTYRKLARERELADARLVLVIDTPWRDTWSQRLGSLLLNRFCNQFLAVVIASDRGQIYSKRLGFNASQTMTGMYGIDYKSFRAGGEHRPNPWPKSFAYIGRYASEKGINELVDGYKLYREMLTDPWPLDCYGSGPLASLLRVPGIVDHGFVQPNDLPNKLAHAGAFVLPSRYEPWGAVIAEAAASGLPIITTSSCGASVDLVHHCFNGYVCASEGRSICDAFIWVHRNYGGLQSMGRSSQRFAEAYSAEAWASRWTELFYRIS
ncbi:glycosyltransferase family 4 protein [Rubripirellula reticaptiva]|uniref:glycosyltransferase family 4 protein n=1 Tax=Rubripirellula reticaptiva TaxID=2528013 RepID=UPI001646CCBE|nr:glycosyltransferase [Rubripirellula reticaptiva]